jgi:hypothetical protein
MSIPRAESRRSLIVAWVGGLVVAAAMCGGYGCMAMFRGVWQNHYPVLAGQWANNGRFALLGFQGTEHVGEELAYAAHVNNAAHHLIAYDPFVRENRSVRLFWVSTAFNMGLGAMQFFLKDMNKTWLFAKFLCCAAWFASLYFLALRSTESEALSVFYAAFITGFSYLLTFLFVSDWTWGGGILRSLGHNAWSMVAYGRTESVLRFPRAGFTYSFLYFAVYCLIKTLETDEWLWAAAAGLLGGVLAYVHIDVWLSFLGATGLLAVVYWFRNRGLFWKIFVSGALASFLSLPFLLTNYPPDHEMVARVLFGAETPPSFIPSSLIYLLAFGAVLRWKRKPVDLVVGALVGASFFMMHAGFILGYSFDPYRWQFIGNIYLVLLLLSFLPRRVAERKTPWLAAAAAATFFAFMQGVTYAAIHFPFQGLPRDYDAALTWLDKNAPVDSVVLSINPEVNGLVPVYSNSKVLLPPAAPMFSDYPLIKTYENLLGGLRLLGADEKRFLGETLLDKKAFGRRDVLATGLAREEIDKTLLYTWMFHVTPVKTVQRVYDEGRGHPAAVDPDYVWFGALEKEYARRDLGKDAGWTEVYRNPTVAIYARRRPS